MKTLPSLAALAALSALAAPALAAPKANLAVSVSAPSVHVRDSAQYTVTVANTGNAHALNTTLAIQLPDTNTSPVVHVMGQLGALPSGCSRSGALIRCNLGTVARGGSRQVSFSLALPYSWAPLEMSASAATSTADSNPANNSANLALAPATYPASLSTAMLATHTHCSGTNLTSFYECELYPSSQASFEAIYELNGDITLSDAPPEFSGRWSVSPSGSLLVEFFELGLPYGSLEARGVGGDCYDGPLLIAGNNPIPYRICLQLSHTGRVAQFPGRGGEAIAPGWWGAILAPCAFALPCWPR